MDDFAPYIAIAIGCYLTWKIIRTVLKDRRVDDWPKARGVVSRSEVINESEWRGSRYVISFSAEVDYQFDTEEDSHKGSGIDLMESSFFFKFFASKVVQKYPVDSEVTVYYNPDDPNESYLERDSSLYSYLLLSVIALFCLGHGIYRLFLEK